MRRQALLVMLPASDVANCGTCHWSVPIEERQEDEMPLDCTRETHSGADFHTDYPRMMRVRPSFGCVQWEPKP